jgi:hypothetical protein
MIDQKYIQIIRIQQHLKLLIQKQGKTLNLKIITMMSINYMKLMKILNHLKIHKALNSKMLKIKINKTQ